MRTLNRPDDADARPAVDFFKALDAKLAGRDELTRPAHNAAFETYARAIEIANRLIEANGIRTIRASSHWIDGETPSVSLRHEKESDVHIRLRFFDDGLDVDRHVEFYQRKRDAVVKKGLPLEQAEAEIADWMTDVAEMDLDFQLHLRRAIQTTAPSQAIPK